jgi:hypothetical protein
MAKQVNLSTTASTSADDFKVIHSFVEESADDNTLAKRLRIAITGTVNSDDPAVPSGRKTLTYRLQGTAQPNDGDADGSNQNNPLPFDTLTGAQRTSIGSDVRAMYKQWRKDVNDDVE